MILKGALAGFRVVEVPVSYYPRIGKSKISDTLKGTLGAAWHLYLCARRIPMGSSLAAAISEVGLDAADHPLDSEHSPHLRNVALAHT
jgi:hypothetical protein